jgi:enamine deaminase RidA (YjgF/YER057c/UK114 family)
MRRVITTPEFSHFPHDWHMSPVLDTGDFVFFSGITGTHPDLSVADDPGIQFGDTFRFLLANLEAAGLTFRHIVEMTTYHVALRKHLNAFIKAKDEFISEPYPAWTAIGVTERRHALVSHDDVCSSAGHDGFQFRLFGLRYPEPSQRLLQVVQEGFPLGRGNHQISV